ncbi:endoplasmin [Tanacetum coccineum]
MLIKKSLHKIIDALRMLGTIATGVAIDAYGPICDNVGCIAEMAGTNLPLKDESVLIWFSRKKEKCLTLSHILKTVLGQHIVGFPVRLKVWEQTELCVKPEEHHVLFTDTTEGLKLGKDSKDKVTKESFKEFTKWWKETLATKSVHNVKISSRLADNPCVVVTSRKSDYTNTLCAGCLFCTFGAQHFWCATMVIARTLRFEAGGKVAAVYSTSVKTLTNTGDGVWSGGLFNISRDIS